jgi:CheY-like chemotaxis protein
MTLPTSVAATPVVSNERLGVAAGEWAASSSYILIVDDEAVVRDFLARCLEKEGYAVKLAGSGAEAMEFMASEPAAAVLCDIRMPGEDGLSLAERMHTHWPQTPIVMASGIDDADTVRKSREFGAADYIAKPIVRKQLLEVIRRVTATSAVDNTSVSISDSEEAPRPGDRIDAEYALESMVRCPACGERISTLKAVRLIRSQVNFISTLPRRGRVLACPHCLSIVPAELTNF